MIGAIVLRGRLCFTDSGKWKRSKVTRYYGQYNEEKIRQKEDRIETLPKHGS